MRTHIFVRTHRFLQNDIFPLSRVAGGDVVGLDQEVGDLLGGALRRLPSMRKQGPETLMAAVG